MRYLKQQVRVKKWSGSINLPTAIGIIDSSSYIYLISGINEISFYSFIIFSKMAIIYTIPSFLRNKNRFNTFFIIAFLAVMSSSLANATPIVAIARPIAVCLSTLLTIYLIEHNIKKYAMGYAISGFASSILFLLYVNLGLVDEIWGRYNFFGNTHPNAGGELISATLIMSTLALRPFFFFLLIITSFYCSILLQSRTGTLAIIIAILCYGFEYYRKIIGLRRAILLSSFLTWAAATFAILLAVIQSDGAKQVYSLFYDSIFLVEDQYRGSGTGLSGRNENWMEAIRVAMDHPFLGAGPDFMERLGILLQPHNWLLYAVSQFGLLGWALIVIFGMATYVTVRNDPIRAMVLIPMVVPWLLNDRFLNFNAYPFALYIVVFASFSSHRLKLDRQRPS